MTQDTRRGFLRKALAAAGAALTGMVLGPARAAPVLRAAVTNMPAAGMLASDKTYWLDAVRCRVYFQSLEDTDFSDYTFIDAELGDDDAA